MAVAGINFHIYNSRPCVSDHKLVKYLSSGGVVVSTWCCHYNDAGSVPTLVTDELQIERNASDNWERSV